MMGYMYEQRKRPQGPKNTAPEPAAVPGPTMDALMRGAARPTAAQKGRPFDLDAAMKAKMENAFGDLSAVKFYQSQAVADAGAEAIAQGNEIAFAPGMANFSTRSGQERLGHELSHVMSQRSGQVRGRGFLADSALEARADREGAMAAAGQQVYTGPVTHAISDASPSPMAAGAMQARKATEEEKNEGAMELLKRHKNWISYDEEKAKPDYQAIVDEEIAGVHQAAEKNRALEEEFAFQRYAKEHQNRDPNTSFNFSIDAGSESQGETSSPETTDPEVDNDALQAARRRGMINALTAKSQNHILNNWKQIMDQYDEYDDEGIATTVLDVEKGRKDTLNTKTKLMRSSEFKKWMKQKVKYGDMSDEKLTRKYNDLLTGKKWWQFWK